MKKSLKRIITTILAVATVGSTAVLFTGCGEKSDEEKVKDALNDFAAGAMDDLSAMNDLGELSSPETEPQKETVKLDLLNKIISDKLYTVKYYDESDYYNGFYIRLNDTVDIDGYTVELREKTDKYDYNPNTMWDIKKGGEKLASFVMTRDTEATKEISNNKIVVSIGESTPFSEDNSEVEFEFTEKSCENIEIDVPAELTEAECKQHIDELKEAASVEFKKDNMYSSFKTPKLDGVYYFLGDAANARVIFVYSVNYFDQDSIVYVESDRPFILDGELNFFGIDSNYIGSKSDIEHGYASGAIDLTQGTKIG